MTREQHIGIEVDRLLACPGWDRQSPVTIRNMAITNVDCFVRHGILKLDEPKSAISKKIEKACSLSATKAADWQRLVRGLELAGLRIVEK